MQNISPALCDIVSVIASVMAEKAYRRIDAGLRPRSSVVETKLFHEFVVYMRVTPPHTIVLYLEFIAKNEI